MEGPAPPPSRVAPVGATRHALWRHFTSGLLQTRPAFPSDGSFGFRACVLWDCISGTLSGHLLQICSFCVFTLLGLKMGVGGPGQTEVVVPTLVSSLLDSTSVCLSASLCFGIWSTPLPPTLAAGQMNAAAELQHRPLDASASRLTCAFQLLGCVCGSTSPWHGRHCSSEPEKGSLSCPPARLSLQTEDWSMKGEPRRLWLCCISRTNPRRLCAVDLAVGRDRRAARLILQGLCLRLCVYVVMREREVNQGYPSACPPGGSGRHAAHLGAGGCTVGGVPGGVCRSPLSSSTCRSPLGGPEPGLSGGRL